MSSGLDKYLGSVAHELRGLPEERREEEVREMRGHLEAIVARLVESGLSQEEATEAALAQFGKAQGIGREMARVVVRAEDESALRIVTAPLLALACCMAILGSEAAFLMPLYILSPLLHTAVLYLLALVPGVLAGRVSPRWGGISSVLLCCPLLAWFHGGSLNATCWLFGFLVAGSLAGSLWARREPRKELRPEHA